MSTPHLPQVPGRYWDPIWCGPVQAMCTLWCQLLLGLFLWLTSNPQAAFLGRYILLTLKDFKRLRNLSKAKNAKKWQRLNVNSKLSNSKPLGQSILFYPVDWSHSSFLLSDKTLEDQTEACTTRSIRSYFKSLPKHVVNQTQSQHWTHLCCKKDVAAENLGKLLETRCQGSGHKTKSIFLSL